MSVANGSRRWSKAIDGGQVHRVVAFPHIECAAIGLHAFDDGGDHDVGVGIAVAVRVGAQVVGQQKAAHLDEMRDGLAVVSGHARRKILRRLDAARCGLDGQSGNGDRRAGPAGIGVQDFVAHQDALRRVGILNVQPLTSAVTVMAFACEPPAG